MDIIESDYESDKQTQNQIKFQSAISLIKRRIKSIWFTLEEISAYMPSPDQVMAIHVEFNELLDYIKKQSPDEDLEELPIPKSLNYRAQDLARQLIKSDVLKTADFFNIDLFNDISKPYSNKIPPVNVTVVQSNIQNSQNIAEAINKLDMSEIKKTEIKQLFDTLENTVKDTKINDSEKKLKLKQLFKEVQNFGIDAGILCLRFIHENGLLNKLF